VSCVALTNVVVRPAPFHCTVEVEVNPVPLTVSVSPPAPAVALLGASEATEGAGLLMAKLRTLDVPPPGAALKTETPAEPTAARSATTIEALSWVLVTKLVTRSLPFQRTTDAGAKFEPLTVSVNAPPLSSPDDGESDVTEGAGFGAAPMV